MPLFVKLTCFLLIILGAPQRKRPWLVTDQRCARLAHGESVREQEGMDVGQETLANHFSIIYSINKKYRWPDFY